MAVKLTYFFLIVFVSNAWAQTELELMDQINKKHKKENTRLLKAMEAEDEIDSEKYSDELKDIYWKFYESQSGRILDAKKLSDKVKALQEEFLKKKGPLVALEHNEDEADKLEEKVVAHMKLLHDKIYHKNKYVFIDYVSWQREASIKSATARTPLIITSHGVCAGGGWGYQNAFYHVFLDGCFMYGYGNVGAEVSSLTYKQSNIPTYGFKASVGAGMIVSSLGAEVGLKLPVLYSHLELDRPDQNKFPGYKVDEETPFMPMASLYSRWPVQKWFIQTEFAKVIGKDLTLWALGAGHTF